MSKIAKALVATLTALGTWGATAFADGELNAVEAFGLCGVLVAGITVWAVPNTDGSDERGASDLAVVLAALLLAVALVLVFGVRD
jgi:hypothetical protein